MNIFEKKTMGNNDIAEQLFGGAAFAFIGFFIILYIVIIVLSIISSWKIFEKAGREGWIALIPFYNIYVHFEICGKPGWWTFLFFVPLANIYVLVMFLVSQIELAKRFGKTTGFGIGLIFMPTIFRMILAFDDSKYQVETDVVKEYLNEQQ
jgi:hypothetical protein